MDNKIEFEKDLQHIINIHSIDNDLNIPDFILAEYLVGVIEAKKLADNKTRVWHGDKTNG